MTTRSAYVAVLAFSSTRIVAYLPTLYAIHQSGDASQHSLWTWFTFFASNLTMAAWLYEQGERRATRAVVVSACNALMCAAVTATVGYYRL